MIKRLTRVLPLLAAAGMLAACGQVQAAEQTGDPGTDAAGSAAAEEAGTITVTDDLDREVTIPARVDRAVVTLSYNNEFVQAIGAGETVVGIDRGTLERDPYLGFDESEVVGESIGELNYESIVALDPDVAIIPRNGAWQEAADQLEQFEIPVVVVSAWDFDVFDETVELLGEVFGEPEGAAKVQDFYHEIFDTVAERVDGLDPVPVYWETDKPYVTALPGSGFDAIITAAGGTNVFGDVDGGDAQFETTVDPASVVTRNPAVIVHERPPSAAPYPAGEIADLAASIPERPGFAGIDAVTGSQVYVSNGWATSGLSKAIGAAYLASWLHPEAFTGIDPADYLERWAVEFQGISEADYAGADAYVWGNGS
ncbi:ABC transporter substrate-binding protein [Pseudactinotalea sp. HY160]|uniref:ABC transporter substrate-binding protein n=1 Tax=Pseudactinotalea sp. HY160 TaxID=2654490 RepID=UPI001D13F079|nr:ABC transporter substrate-binding protein [Pseudactinotalea sp. HY160]